jgi:hypothetical protein
MGTINGLAVVVAALAALGAGAAWYSPAVLGRAWARANGFTQGAPRRGPTARSLALALPFSLAMAALLAFYLSGPEVGVGTGVVTGFAVGLFWAAFGLGIVALFERRPAAYLLINGGYLTVAFTIMGSVLGAWR